MNGAISLRYFVLLVLLLFFTGPLENHEMANEIWRRAQVRPSLRESLRVSPTSALADVPITSQARSATGQVAHQARGRAHEDGAVGLLVEVRGGVGVIDVTVAA